MMLNGLLSYPQNKALQQWFKFESPSSALGGSYSYSGATVLPQPPTPQDLTVVLKPSRAIGLAFFFASKESRGEICMGVPRARLFFSARLRTCDLSG